MTLHRRLPTLLPLVLIAACGSPPPPAAPEPTPAPVAAAGPIASPPDEGPSADFDPVSTGMTVSGVKRLCDDHLAAAGKLVDRIKGLKGAAPEALTFDATVGRFDDVVLEVASAGEFPYLVAVAHPDAAVRDVAKACEPKTDAFATALYLDADVAAVLRAYAAKNEHLDGERKRLLADVLRDFRRNGLELSADKQKELRKLNEDITKLGQDFSSNISSSTGKIEVKASALDGLPPEYKAKHVVKNGKTEIAVDYPDYFPFVTYSRDRKAALELYVKFTNRGGDENVKLLDGILKLRDQKAKLLGYASWAAFAIEPRMAKTPEAVKTFLAQIRAALKEPAKVELAELIKEHVKLGGSAMDKLPPPERYFLQDRVRTSKYKFNSQELSNYLEIGAVKRGLFDITAKMYGIEYREVPANAWHPDVTAYEVWSKGPANASTPGGGATMLGKFYLDLYSRPDKFKHAAMFPLRAAKRLASGVYRTPMAALECNFPKPGASEKDKAGATTEGTHALLSHEEVVTFFHEFGHVLHHLLTRSELASYSGTNTVRDFVEAPSQMFEEWPWSREVLDIFARHHKTGQKIPDDLFAAMQRSRTFGRALETQRQLVFATYDQEVHTRVPGFDTTQVMEEVQNGNDSFAYVKGTHFQSSFGHLIGYDAGYYSYQWALSLSRDVLTRFKKEGLMNASTAAAWRDEVLSRGGGVDERAMIAQFLGRAPSTEPYIAYIRGEQ